MRGSSECSPAPPLAHHHEKLSHRDTEAQRGGGRSKARMYRSFPRPTALPSCTRLPFLPWYGLRHCARKPFQKTTVKVPSSQRSTAQEAMRQQERLCAWQSNTKSTKYSQSELATTHNAWHDSTTQFRDGASELLPGPLLTTTGSPGFRRTVDCTSRRAMSSG